MQISQLGEKYKVKNVINTAYKCGGNSLNAVGLSLKNSSNSVYKNTGNYHSYHEVFSAVSRILMTS